jgi:predicted Zn finger-like uncharacterized protein
MLIVCPDCSTSYQVEIASLGEDGRSVRCARCQTVWFAEAPKALMVLEGTASSTQSYEEPPARHDEWWAGDRPPEQEPSPGDEAWGIAAGEVPSEMAESSQQDSTPTEPITIEISADAPPLVPVAEDASNQLTLHDHEGDQGTAIDVETIAARGAKLAVAPRAERKRRHPGIGLAAVMLMLVAVGLVAGRAQVVRYAPQTAALYKTVGLPVNLRGLNFTDVRISGENENDVPVLVVAGTIVNSVNRPVSVPRLRFALLNPSGLETYAWTAVPARTVLGEGETVAFRSRLASPPANIRDVQVRFLNRRDGEAGR